MLRGVGLNGLTSSRIGGRRRTVGDVHVGGERGGARFRRRARGAHGGVDLGARGLVDRGQLRRGQQAGARGRRGEPGQAVVLGAQPLGLALGAVELPVEPFHVGEEPARAADEDRGSPAGARPLDGRAGGLVDRQEVGAVDGRGDGTEAGGAGLEVLAREVEGGTGGLGVAVVLDDEDAGQLPDAGELDALVEDALVGAAVADEGDRDLSGAAVLGRQRRADGEGHAARGDAVGAEQAGPDVGDVHRAALAAAQAVAAAEDLQHHAGEVAALGDRVAVAAVRAGDEVVGAQVRADADGDRLLARVEVHGARYVAGRVLGVQALLELPDGAHLPVGRGDPVAVEAGRRAAGRRGGPRVRPPGGRRGGRD